MSPDTTGTPPSRRWRPPHPSSHTWRAITGGPEEENNSSHLCTENNNNSSSNTQPRSLPNRTVSTPLHTLESPRLLPLSAPIPHRNISKDNTYTLTLTPQHSYEFLEIRQFTPPSIILELVSLERTVGGNSPRGEYYRFPDI